MNLIPKKPALSFGHLFWLCIASAFSLFLQSCILRHEARLPHYAFTMPQRAFVEPSKEKLDSLLSLYGNKKIFVPEFVAPSLIALSFYPDLKDTDIEFMYSTEATTMAARPKASSIFGKRKYLILINNDPNFEGIQLKDISFNAQVGVIGHELAHVFQYESSRPC